MTSGNHDKSFSSLEYMLLEKNSLYYILMLFLLIFVGFLVLGKDFINLLVGEEYTDSYYCTLLICAYGFFAYPQQIANTYVMVKNRVKARAYISIAAFIINVSLSFLFGWLWGAKGVALAVFFALILYTLMMNILYHKGMQLNMFFFFKKCHLKMLPGIVVFSASAIALGLLPLDGWLGFLVKMISICAVYAVVVWLLWLDRNEKMQLLKRRSKR